MKHFLVSGIAGISLFSANAASAQTQSPVELRSAVWLEKAVIENGIERRVLIEPKVVVPGDTLLFSTAYRNTAATAVDAFVVTNPIPAAVSLAPTSAATLQVSVDGGKGWGSLASLRVADGKGGLRPAQANDVSHVRWTLSLIAPGAGGKLEYYAIVR